MLYQGLRMVEEQDLDSDIGLNKVYYSKVQSIIQGVRRGERQYINVIQRLLSITGSA